MSALHAAKRLTKEDLRALTITTAAIQLETHSRGIDDLCAQVLSLVEEVEAWRALEPSLDRLTAIGADVARIRRWT